MIKSLAPLILTLFVTTAHSQSLLAQNEDAFVIGRVGNPVVSGMLFAFTLGLSQLAESSETSKQKKKWAKIIEVAQASGCKALAVASKTHDDPEIAIRGKADSRGYSTFLRSNGAHLHFADPYNNGGYWGTVNVGLAGSDTMFICARDDSALHSSFKSLAKLEKDLRLEGMLD
jgi:hypothetical protein